MKRMVLLLILAVACVSAPAWADDALKTNVGYPLGYAESFNQSVDKAKLTAIFSLLPDSKRSTYLQLGLQAAKYSQNDMTALSLAAIKITDLDVSQQLQSQITVSITGVVSVNRIGIAKDDIRLLVAFSQLQLDIKTTLDDSDKLNRAYVDGSIDKSKIDNSLHVNRLSARRQMDLLNAYWYLADNENDDALRILDGIIATDAHNAVALQWRGVTWYYLDKYDLALIDLQNSLKLQPDNNSGYYYIGNCYYVQNDYDTAIVNYTKAIAIGAPEPREYYYRGNCYRKQNKYDAAIADYSSAINLDIAYANAYVNRGDCYLYSGKYDEAGKDYDVAIKLGKEDGYLFFNRGAIYLKNGDVDNAINCFERTTKLLPNYADGYYNKALAYDQKLFLIKQGKVAGNQQSCINNALAAYKQFIALADPKRPEVQQAQKRIKALTATVVLDIY